MKAKSSIILIVGTLFLVGCATVGPNSAPVSSDSRAVAERMAVSLIFNETPFFINMPTPEQTLVSGDQYYLEDIYDYDEAFLVTQPVIKQTLASRSRYYLEDIYDYDALFIIQPIVRQALLSGTRYYLEDIYDYDEAFLNTQIQQTADSKNVADYFAVMSIFDDTSSSMPEPASEKTLASGGQYYLEDIYDYAEANSGF